MIMMCMGFIYFFVFIKLTEGKLKYIQYKVIKTAKAFFFLSLLCKQKCLGLSDSYVLEDWTHRLPTEVSSMFSFGDLQHISSYKEWFQSTLCNEIRLKPQTNVLSIMYNLYLHRPSKFH